jgi:hypothetical protein
MLKSPLSTSGDSTIADVPLNNDDVRDSSSVQPSKRLRGRFFSAVPNRTLAAAHDQDAQDEIAPLSANVNDALRIVSKLEQLGLDKQQISLPKCVVLGTCVEVPSGQQCLITNYRPTVNWQVFRDRSDLWYQDT